VMDDIYLIVVCKKLPYLYKVLEQKWVLYVGWRRFYREEEY
jgi:hypothetical protein